MTPTEQAMREVYCDKHKRRWFLNAGQCPNCTSDTQRIVRCLDAIGLLYLNGYLTDDEKDRVKNRVESHL